MSSMQYSSEIMFPIKMGEEQSFDWIFRAYHATLCHFCEQLINEDAVAQDVVTELFLTLWQKNTTFESQDHVQAYLYRSARNACLNLLTRDRKISEKQSEIIALYEDNSDADHLNAMIRSEVWGEIYRAIESLPGQCNKVICMSYIEGKSNSEIAEELALSMQTVKNYKQRGLQLLKDKLPDNLLILLLIYQYLN